MRRHHHGLPWPRRDRDEQVACEFCDAVQPAPRLREGEGAYCGNCGELLYQNRPRSLSRATGFSIAALIFMLLAHSFPFLTMSAAGASTKLSLIRCARALSHDGDVLLSWLCIFFTIIAPLALVGSLLYMSAPLLYGRALPGALQIARWFQRSEPWAMLEVFLLGFIVSLLKLGHLAEIHFNIGLWSLVALVICIAGATAGIDRRELWDRLELAVDPAPKPEPVDRAG
ncbi:paraquat-inducible protein A [Haloferula helveola]|uniref:Paraquat-inducible protein A n=1 Tax=Haloferula helveola TaxID=490095 RepID=A0ABN6GYR2_9BACT|nr:paraquat-inducible protein A [Haloferula helveola]